MVHRDLPHAPIAPEIEWARFAVSTLLLNHPKPPAEADSGSTPLKQTYPIEVPDGAGEVEQVRAILRQLTVTGEIEQTTSHPAVDRFDFRVVRPGRIVEVKTDPGKRRATVQEIRVNAWGVIRMLHTFTGQSANAPQAERDWLLSRLWSLSMDAVALGLVVLVISSLIMTFGRRERLFGAGIALGLRVAVGAFFLLGPRWL
jgi:hypothetical protein